VDGTYRGKSQGYVGEIVVEITIRDGQLDQLKVVEHLEYEHKDAIQKMEAQILAAKGITGVDAVTGATETSRAILKATEAAMKRALRSPVVEGEPNVSPCGHITAKKSMGAKTLLPAPVWVIGSYDSLGKPNMMTAAWVGICCSRPPCVTISLRKATYTYSNIMQRKAFTVNLPSEDFAKETAYFGSVSGRDVNKLEATGLSSIRATHVDAPCLQEFPLVVECKVIHMLEVGLHTMFIGEIMDVKADQSVLGDNGSLDAGKLKTFLFSPGSGSFYKTGGELGKISDLWEEVKHRSIFTPSRTPGLTVPFRSQFSCDPAVILVLTHLLFIL
jgi:flavin reductase (DIM6/NTAB) family NADH-FMN oxidoreductase RutF